MDDDQRAPATASNRCAIVASTTTSHTTAAWRWYAAAVGPSRSRASSRSTGPHWKVTDLATDERLHEQFVGNHAGVAGRELRLVDRGDPHRSRVVTPPAFVYVAASGGGIWKSYDFLEAR